MLNSDSVLNALRVVIDPATVPNDIHATELWTIGNYALGVVWSDGHSTGYFPFQTIEALAARDRP